jgi:hypothetical protein
MLEKESDHLKVPAEIHFIEIHFALAVVEKI